MSVKEGISVLINSTQQIGVLGSVLSKVKLCQDLRFHTDKQLYKSCVCLVLDYALAFLGYCEHVNCNTVHYRASRWFLGVHKLIPVLAISDMWREPPNARHMADNSTLEQTCDCVIFMLLNTKLFLIYKERWSVDIW